MKNKLENAKLEPLWNTNKIIILLMSVSVIALFLFPLLKPNSFYLHLMITIFMYAVMAQSWNVIAGFSGQISLGHVIFFGIGCFGLTSVVNSSESSPSINRKADISIISSLFLSRPVVSKSNAIKLLKPILSNKFLIFK